MFILFPNHTQEQRTSRRHHSDVRHSISLRVPGQRLDCLLEEWVAWDGPHSVVADTCWDCAAQPGGELEHDVEAAGASIIEIEVDAAVVVEDEVADRIGALDVVGVVIEGLEELGVFVGDEGAGEVVRPKL